VTGGGDGPGGFRGRIAVRFAAAAPGAPHPPGDCHAEAAASPGRGHGAVLGLVRALSVQAIGPGGANQKTLYLAHESKEATYSLFRQSLHVKEEEHEAKAPGGA
jgi:hypothetical protein